MKKKINILLVVGAVAAMSIAIGYMQANKATTTVFLPTTLFKDNFANNQETVIQISDFQIVSKLQNQIVLRFTEPVTAQRMQSVDHYELYVAESLTSASVSSLGAPIAYIQAKGSGSVQEIELNQSFSGYISNGQAFILKGVGSKNEELAQSNTILIGSSVLANRLSIIDASNISGVVNSSQLFLARCALGKVGQTRVYLDVDGDESLQGSELDFYLIGSAITGAGKCPSE